MTLAGEWDVKRNFNFDLDLVQCGKLLLFDADYTSCQMLTMHKMTLNMSKQVTNKHNCLTNQNKEIGWQTDITKDGQWYLCAGSTDNDITNDIIMASLSLG